MEGSEAGMPGVVVVLVFSKKKGELWQHKKNTNMVTNSNAASFGSSGLIPLTLTAPMRCFISLGVDEVGVISAIV